MSIASPLDTSRSNVGIAATALLLVVLAVLLKRTDLAGEAGADPGRTCAPGAGRPDRPVQLGQHARGPAATFYQWNSRIRPNSAIYLLLAGQSGSPARCLDFANFAIHSRSVACFGSPQRCAVGRAETEPLLPILLLLPLAFWRLVRLGFYNFSLGVPLFLLFAS